MNVGGVGKSLLAKMELAYTSSLEHTYSTSAKCTFARYSTYLIKCILYFAHSRR